MKVNIFPFATAVLVALVIGIVVYRFRKTSNKVRKVQWNIRTKLENTLTSLAYDLQLHPDTYEKVIIDTVSSSFNEGVLVHLINFYDNNHFTFCQSSTHSKFSKGKNALSGNIDLEEIFHNWYRSKGVYPKGQIITKGPFYTSHFGDRIMVLHFTTPIYSQRQDGKLLFLLDFELNTKLRKHNDSLVLYEQLKD